MKPFTNEFVVDREIKSISFADVEFNTFQMLNKASDVRSIMGFFETSGNVRWARAFSDKYGITPAKFKKVFNALMMNVWVDPIKEHANRFAYNSRKKLNPWMIKKIWINLEIVEQAKRDGIYNIVPWILEKEDHPQGLKEDFGKSVWKKICKQSMTRNKFLASGAKRFRYGENNIQTALELPSYMLKKGGNCHFQWTASTKWLFDNKQLNSKNFVRNNREQVLLARTYEDTKRMSEELGKSFNHNWSIDKMKEKHTEYVKLVNLKRYSPEPFNCLKDFSVKEVSHKGYIATLLDSASLVHGEGQAMHHCVGGYVESVRQGRYLVYSITKDGKRSSTVAFSKAYDPSGLSDYKEWMFNQHYGYCNAHIQDEDEKEISGLILSQLNK